MSLTKLLASYNGYAGVITEGQVDDAGEKFKNYENLSIIKLLLTWTGREGVASRLELNVKPNCDALGAQGVVQNNRPRHTEFLN